MAKVVIPVDVSEVEARQFQQPSPGMYTMAIKEANHRDTDGKNDIELVLQVVGGEFDGSQLWTYVGLTEASQWKLRELLDALGLPAKIQLDLTKHLVNKKMKVKVNGDQYQGEYRARVGRFAPLDASAGAGEASAEVASESADDSEEPWTEDDLKALNDDELKEALAEFELKDVKTSGRGWKTKAIAAILTAQEAESGGDEEPDYGSMTLAELVAEIVADDDLKALLPGIEEDGSVSDEDKDYLVGFLEAADAETVDDYLKENPWDEEAEGGGEKPDYSTWSIGELKEEIGRRGLTAPRRGVTQEKLIGILEKSDGEDGDPFAS